MRSPVTPQDYAGKPFLARICCQMGCATTFLDTQPLRPRLAVDAMRVFIAAFNREGGFPFAVRLPQPVEPFPTEAEATGFAAAMSLRMLDEAR